MRFAVVLEPDRESSGFNLVVPALPGCFTQGDTIGECLVRARDAIATYLEEVTRERLRVAGVDLDLIVDVVDVEMPLPT